MDREGDGVQAGHHGGKAGSPGVMAILIPPPILEKVQTVLDLPMAANVAQQVGGANLVGVEARHKIANVVRDDLAALGAELAIDADRDPTARQVQRLANIVRVV